jgi:predicted nucleic acid-binding protein
MKDKAFIDTNIFVYAFLYTENSVCHAKHLKAVDFLKIFHSGMGAICAVLQALIFLVCRAS